MLKTEIFPEVPFPSVQSNLLVTKLQWNSRILDYFTEFSEASEKR